MTIRLNFNTTNRKKLLGIVKWLKEIGLIESFDLDAKKEKSEREPEEDTETFIARMIKEGEEEVANGEVYSQAEVEQKVKEWQASRM